MNKKKALAALLVFTVVVIVAYAMAAFVNLSFDPHKWSEYGRFVVVVVGTVFGTGAALIAQILKW